MSDFSVAAAVYIPALQSMLFACMGYPFLAGLMLLARVEHPFQAAFLVDAFISWIFYTWLTERWYQLFRWLAVPPALPRLYNSDVHAALTWNEGRTGVWADLGVSRAWLAKWAAGAARGVTLAESVWAGGRNRPSVREYRAFLATLREWEIVGWVHPGAHSQGMRLTEKGQQAAREWAHPPF